jgi:two-component system NarL family response regulator
MGPLLVSKHANPQKAGVGIVETDEGFRRYLVAVVAGTPGLTVTDASPTGKAALRRFERHPPEVLLVDLFLADMTGTELIWQARHLWPDASYLLMIAEQRCDQYLEALESAASGYVSKPCTPEEIVRAIWTVRQGGAVLPAFLAKTVTSYFHARGSVVRQLTCRERQILGCLSCGLSQRETALALGVAQTTIQAHVRSLRARLDAHSTAEVLCAYFNPRDVRRQRVFSFGKNGPELRVSTARAAPSVGAPQVLRCA